jgi:hypothetical protein
LPPREFHELAVVRQRELERGNPNRATLAVARKIVCYLLAVDSGLIPHKRGTHSRGNALKEDLQPIR